MAIDTQNEFRFVQGLFAPDGNSADDYDTLDEFAIVLGIFPFLSWPGSAPSPSGVPNGHADDASSAYYLSGGT